MSFINDRLVLGQVPISHPITTNKIDIWDCTEKAQTIEFSPSASDLKKMNSAYENRKQLAEKLFQNEINNIPHSICVRGKKQLELYHGSKSDITKRFTTSAAPTFDPESMSAIVIEMSPLIKAKAYATQANGITTFGEFSLLLYYEVMKLGANYQRIDCVFDRYFEKSLKESTWSGRGEGSQYPFERDSTTILFQMAESFLSNSDNRDKLNKYLLENL